MWFGFWLHSIEGYIITYEVNRNMMGDHFESKFNYDIIDVSLQSCAYIHYMNESSIVTKPA